MIWANMYVPFAVTSMTRQGEFVKLALHRAQSGKTYRMIGSALSAEQQKRNLKNRATQLYLLKKSQNLLSRCQLICRSFLRLRLALFAQIWLAAAQSSTNRRKRPSLPNWPDILKGTSKNPPKSMENTSNMV